MTCPVESIPAGWRLWRTPVPPELVQFAVDALSHIGRHSYGSITATLDYNGQTVGAWKSHHTWTYRNGQLVTGLCIPGVSLLIQSVGATITTVADLTTPDPNAAVFSEPPVTIDWPVVAASGVAIAAVVGFFLFTLYGTPTPKPAPRRQRIPRAY